jgi:single-strand DNA-binding protein
MATNSAVVRNAEPVHRNEVSMVGRLSSYATAKQLPSGDEVVTWRLVVERHGGGIDVIDCAAFAARLRRSAGKWLPGDTIEVEGALRRRFWRGVAGTASRYEVEVSRAVLRR